MKLTPIELQKLSRKLRKIGFSVVKHGGYGEVVQVKVWKRNDDVVKWTANHGSDVGEIEVFRAVKSFDEVESFVESYLTL